MSSTQDEIHLADLGPPRVSPAPDLEQQREKSPETLSVDISDLQPPYPSSSIDSWRGHCCFVCLNGGHTGHYAIKVPCLKPLHPAQSRRMQMSASGRYQYLEPHYPVVHFKKTWESDPAICYSLNNAYRYCKGQWQKWLFYIRTGSGEKEREDDTAIYYRIKMLASIIRGDRNGGFLSTV